MRTRPESPAKELWKLLAATALSIAYMSASVFLGVFSRRGRLDGIAGILLGLYVCSLPVRHFLDLLIYWRLESGRFATRPVLSRWLLLNAFVLIVGWLVIVYGATRFTAAMS